MATLSELQTYRALLIARRAEIVEGKAVNRYTGANEDITLTNVSLAEINQAIKEVDAQIGSLSGANRTYAKIGRNV